MGFQLGWVAIPVFLILYNAPVFHFRAYGLALGYRKGFDIVNDISMRRLQPWLDVLTWMGVILTGMCLVASAHWGYEKDIRFLMAFIVSVPLGLVLLHLKRSINMILLLAAVIAVLFGFLFHAA